MSKQTDSDTEGMTAEQLAAANERLAKIPGVGTPIVEGWKETK